MKKIILALFIASSCLAQNGPQTVVYTQLITNGTSVLTFTPTVTSIGQTSHVLTAIFSPAPAQSCTVPVPEIVLQGSYDNAKFFAISQTVGVNLTNSLIFTVAASGAYPYVRGNVINFDNTDCILNLYYSGTSISQSTLANGYQTRAGPGNSALNYPMGSSKFIHLSANGTTTFPSTACTVLAFFGTYPTPCGIVASVTINTKGAAANTLTLYTSTTCTGAANTAAVIDTTSTIGTLNYGLLTTDSTGFCAVLATGTAADITINYSGSL